MISNQETNLIKFYSFLQSYRSITDCRKIHVMSYFKVLGRGKGYNSFEKNSEILWFLKYVLVENYVQYIILQEMLLLVNKLCTDYYVYRRLYVFAFVFNSMFLLCFFLTFYLYVFTMFLPGYPLRLCDAGDGRFLSPPQCQCEGDLQTTSPGNHSNWRLPIEVPTTAKTAFHKQYFIQYN